MGWRNFRFEQSELFYTPSALGLSLMREEQMPMGKLIRIPRAIDSMFVILKKIPCSQEEKNEYDFWFKRNSKKYRTKTHQA